MPSKEMRRLMEALNIDEKSNIANNILNDFKRTARFSMIDDPVDHGNEVMAGIRDWGEWGNPVDTPHGDQEDYDWQEMSGATAKKANQILEKYRQLYPDYKIRLVSGEKNWIEIYVSNK